MHAWERAREAMKRYEVIQKGLAGKLTWIEVAEILGLTARQVRRIRKRFETEEERAVWDRRCGIKAWNRVPEEIEQKVLKLYREQYFDFNVKHFHEKLKADHGITQSYEWALALLQRHGVIARHRKYEPHRKKRERRPLPGMMLHLDGSSHRWVGDEGPKWDLLATLDDATNEVYDAFFVREEDTRSVLQILWNTVEKKGAFCSLYTDRATHFVVTPKAGEKVDKRIRTQCQRALDQLGCKLIAAYSPQARGRGERLWRTFQGRLPQELRVAKITEMEEANAYLRATFIPNYNQLFKIKPKEKGTAFTRVVAGIKLERVFSIQCERMVSNDNTISYKAIRFQLPESSVRYSFSRCRVTLHEHLNQSYSITFGPTLIGRYDAQGKELTKPAKAPKEQVAA